MSSSPTTQEVSLLQMLDAREKRAQRQNELLTQYQKPLLCFTMNIAGPIKFSLNPKGISRRRRGYQTAVHPK